MNKRLISAGSVVFCAAWCLGFLGRTAAAGAADDPQPLPLPADAIAVAHVRAADIWHSDILKEVRALLTKAGPELMKAFNERFVPAPSTIDRLTVVVGAPARDGGEPAIAFFLTTSKPFEEDKLVQGAMPGAQEERVGKVKMYVDGKSNMALHVVDDRVIMFGPTAALRAILDKPAKSDGALDGIAKLATAQTPIAIGINMAALPELPRDRIPPPLLPLLDAKLLTATFEIAKEQRIRIALEFPSPDKAGEGEKAAKAGIGMARQALAMARPQLEAMVRGKEKDRTGPLSELPEAIGGLFGLALIQAYDDLLKDFPFQRQGSRLHASLQSPVGFSAANPAVVAVGVGLLLPAVQKVREAASRMKDQNNLKQIALAMHNYHDANGHFPAAAICDKEGKPLLSWRVTLLPYLEQNNLYKQFKLDEPWDGPNNKKLLPIVLKVYELPALAGQGKSDTYYRVFVGDHAPFDPCKGRRVADITDGLSNTFMVVESAQSVPWTKPEDLPYDPNKPVPKLGNHTSGGFNAAFMDGSVRFFARPPRESTLRALITHAGGEVIPLDD